MFSYEFTLSLKNLSFKNTSGHFDLTSNPLHITAIFKYRKIIILFLNLNFETIIVAHMHVIISNFKKGMLV